MPSVKNGVVELMRRAPNMPATRREVLRAPATHPAAPETGRPAARPNPEDAPGSSDPQGRALIDRDPGPGPDIAHRERRRGCGAAPSPGQQARLLARTAPVADLLEETSLPSQQVGTPGRRALLPGRSDSPRLPRRPPPQPVQRQPHQRTARPPSPHRRPAEPPASSQTGRVPELLQ